MRPADALASGAIALRSKPGRSVLTALGIAIGIAAMVAVVGISASSRADLIAELDSLGTNLLQVSPGQTVFGDDTSLPRQAPGMIRRIGPVESAAATRQVDATVRRTDLVPASRTGGIAVMATEPNLADTLDASLAAGTFLSEASSRFPVVVLGSVAAERLGVTSLSTPTAVYLGDRWFTVIGVLDAVPLAPDIDRSALVGFPVASDLFGTDRTASTVRVRTDPEKVDAVRSVLAATAKPAAPEEVSVTRPSDALAARAAADDALTALLLALGAVALVVGGVGIANVMVISVLERRNEIGLRRALGATRGHVRIQFLVEAVLLGGIGGSAGILLGAVVTAAYATARDWSIDVPLPALAAGVGIALSIGAIAGLYPASRAARLAPAEAVR
jgi:putative ABC transport system permease protein